MSTQSSGTLIIDCAYDSNGNTLEASDTSTSLSAGQSAVTSYQYDVANQLVTAQKDLTTWNYAYDANCSLTEVLPGGNEVNSAKRYTYNAAGYLTKVESHDGSSWSTQSEMAYNGLGVRLTSSALGVTTYYASDGQMPLTITSINKTTTILYGLGPIAEKMEEWNYVLSDGVGVPRQLTDSQGMVTLSVRYSPWGKTMEISGTGNFDESFIGTLIDASTGLIYVGNGQYYDPETGRFLTRGANPNSPNPYVPGNPIGMIIGPLGLISAHYARKKAKHAPRWIALLALVLIACISAASLGVMVSNCIFNLVFGPETPPSAGTGGGGGNDKGTGGDDHGTPTAKPPEPPLCPGPNCPSTPTPSPADKFRITADEITQAGGTTLAYFEKEIKEDPALFMARVAMGESANNEERSRIIWLITIRVVLAFNNSNLRSSATMGSSIWDHFGPPSDLHREVLEVSPNEGYQFEDVQTASPITDPPNQATGNIQTMLYPNDSEISDFESIYKVAKEALDAQNETALKNSSNPVLAQIQGYDGYLAPGGGITINQIRYRGGVPPIQFVKESGNVWDDNYPMDNVFFGIISCEDEKGLIRFFHDPSSNGQGDWLARLFAPSDPDQIACPNY